MDKGTAGFVGFLIGVGLMVLFLSLIFIGDSTDVIDTKALGKIMCRDKGLEYDHRQIVSRTIDDKEGAVIPIIYCKKPEFEQELLDGILLGPTIEKEPMVIKTN